MRHNRIIMSAFQSAEQLDIVQEINRASNIETGAMVFPLPGESHYHRARGLPSNHLWTRIAKIDNPIRTTNKIKTSLRSLPLIPIHSHYMAVETVAVRLKTTSTLSTKKRRRVFGEHRRSESDGGYFWPGRDQNRHITQKAKATRLMVSVGNRVLFGLSYLLFV
jgi:hypothetical protein